MDTSIQAIYGAKDHTVTFRSEAPLETIEAVCRRANILYRPSTAEVQITMSIADFTFPNALMQEHFNDNYMESEKYPKATFRGKVKEAVNWATPGKVPVTVDGVLELHGVRISRAISGTIEHDLNRNIMRISSSFDVPVAAHNITIPAMYLLHIASSIRVKVEAEMTKSERR